MATDTGGPAFPSYDGAILGVTVRDYFVAHAPAEPWPDFYPAMSGRPEQPPSTPVGNEGDAPSAYELDRLHAWRMDDFTPLPTSTKERFSCWMDAVRAYRKAVGEYEKERERQRRIQWPEYWADLRIARRNQHSNSPQSQTKEATQ